MKTFKKDSVSNAATTIIARNNGTHRSVRITNSSDEISSSILKINTNNNDNSLSNHSLGNGMEDIKSLQEKQFRMKEELKIAQESFISRERSYQLHISELEEELYNKRQEKTGWMRSDPKISKLKEMQSQIINNVSIVQDRFSRIIQEQEKDLLRAFKIRLLDVQAELESQKSKKDDGAAAYIELSKTKEYDVEREKVKADLKERQNQALLQNNNRLKSEFESREEDRNFLAMQINAARNDNARLKNEFNDLEKEQKMLQEQFVVQSEKLVVPPQPVNNRKLFTTAQLQQAQVDAEERYKEINARLRKLLAEERRSLQQVRVNYNSELEARTDLELMLRQTVEEVKLEQDAITKTTDSIRPNHTAMIRAIKVNDEEQREIDKHFRERVLEVLLSREQVSSLIFANQTIPSGTLTLTSNNNANSNNNHNNTTTIAAVSTASNHQNQE